MNHQPRKRFGQNFLRDTTVIRQILLAVNPDPLDHLVEIGPGEGVLTEALLPHCQFLDAIEIDRDLITKLKNRFGQISRFRLHHADALKFDLSSLNPDKKLRVIGNLPYNISTPLLFHLFEQVNGVRDMHFMLQKEVVDRLCAEPGDQSYGRLGVMVQYYCRTEALFEVAPESFFPKPRVTSMVVRLIPHPARPVNVGPDDLGRIVMAAFSQRRKTLRNALKPLLNEEEIMKAGIAPTARAETLSLEDYARLTHALLDQQRDEQA